MKKWLNRNIEKIIAVVFLTGGFLILGFVGALENEHISFGGFIIRSLIVGAVMGATGVVAVWNDV